MSEDDRAKIKVAKQPLPYVASSVFQEKEIFGDRLKVRRAMDNLLSAKSSYAIPAPFVFIDRSDIPNALTFNGQYKVDDQSVDLEGSLLCAGKLLQHFHVSGKSSDLEGLTLSAFNKVAVPDRCDVESPKFIEHALHKKKWIDTENALTSII